ncbi:hypothetical protein GCM10009665_43480 [Kitasatospora nipponensis]|uniref:Uncharacterized protein n=1 Tax=Kitasatospora nipponensis TaxID=258049 RepID=A0ABN1WEK0_9ACTN
MTPGPCGNCAVGTPAGPTASCARDSHGVIMTCDPVRTGIPIPRTDTPTPFVPQSLPPTWPVP